MRLRTYSSQIMSSLRRLLYTIDNIKSHHIRWVFLPYFLAMPLALMIANMYPVLFYSDMRVCGFDAGTLQIAAFFAGALALFAIRRKDFILFSRIAALAAAFGLLAHLLYPSGMAGLLFSELCMLGMGGCAISATYAYCAILFKSERFLSIVIIAVNLSLSGIVSSPAASPVYSIGAVVVAALLLTCMFLFRGKDFPGDRAQERKPIPKAVYLGLIYFSVFFIINFFISYLVGTPQDFFYPAGCFAAILVCIVVQYLLTRSVWYMWNLYLLSIIAGILLLILPVNPILRHSGFFFNGLAEIVGYIVSVYMCGELVNRFLSFQMFKKLLLLFMGIPLIGAIGAGFVAGQWPAAVGSVTIALAVIAAVVIILLSPVFCKYLFANDLLEHPNDGKTLPTDLFDEFAQRVRKLTPTEKKVFEYYMEGKTSKEVMGLLFISLSTIKAHNSHIYEKLNVSSRDELMLYIELIKRSGKVHILN